MFNMFKSKPKPKPIEIKKCYCFYNFGSNKVHTSTDVRLQCNSCHGVKKIYLKQERINKYIDIITKCLNKDKQFINDVMHKYENIKMREQEDIYNKLTIDMYLSIIKQDRTEYVTNFKLFKLCIYKMVELIHDNKLAFCVRLKNGGHTEYKNSMAHLMSFKYFTEIIRYFDVHLDNLDEMKYFWKTEENI